MNSKTISIIIIVLALVFVGLAVFKKKENKPIVHLPYFGNDIHTVGNFSFTDQNGNTVTEADYKDKIYVADYFFTTCKSICPVMSSAINKLNKHFKDNPNIYFLSHTVDPEYDSVKVLNAYAQLYQAEAPKWRLVTGDKKELYKAARQYYLLPDIQPGDGSADDFIHSQHLVLIDKEKRIRGFYDGTNDKEVEKLIIDINVLLKED